MDMKSEQEMWSDISMLRLTQKHKSCLALFENGVVVGQGSTYRLT